MGLDKYNSLCIIILVMIIISILGGYPMKNNSNTLGLHNMNGLSADDKRTCALNDMNWPRRSAGADCVFAMR